MINSNTKQSIKVTFERLQSAYTRLDVKGAHDYYLTLGNVNEVHLIKKDATKSVFLGKLFVDENSTMEVEAKRVWIALENYFKATSQTTKVASETTTTPTVEKKVSKKTKKQVVEEPQVEVSEEDEDSSWVDSVL